MGHLRGPKGRLSHPGATWPVTEQFEPSQGHFHPSLGTFGPSLGPFEPSVGPSKPSWSNCDPSQGHSSCPQAECPRWGHQTPPPPGANSSPFSTLQRLRTENRLLKQRIETLEKVNPMAQHPKTPLGALKTPPGCTQPPPGAPQNTPGGTQLCPTTPEYPKTPLEHPKYPLDHPKLPLSHPYCRCPEIPAPMGAPLQPPAPLLWAAPPKSPPSWHHFGAKIGNLGPAGGRFISFPH